MVFWMLSSKSRGTSAGGRVIPRWTRLQIPFPYLKFLFIQKSLAFKWALGRELLGTSAPGRPGAGVEQRRERCPSAHSAGVGDTRQDKVWDPPCAHSSGVPAGH